MLVVEVRTGLHMDPLVREGWGAAKLQMRVSKHCLAQLVTWVGLYVVSDPLVF